MIFNDTVTGAVAVVIAYLLGAIPAAYLVTRLATGKDIRTLGGGNVGARNVFVEVGKAAGIGVGLFDLAKGVGAVAIASWALHAPTYFVLGAGLAAVVGHIWSVYLKFGGGNGLATTLGVLALLMTRELLIALALTIVFWVITHNVILSLNMSLLSLPVSGWSLERSWVFVVFPLVLIVVMVINFFPVVLADVTRAGSREDFFAQLFRRDKRKGT